MLQQWGVAMKFLSKKQVREKIALSFASIDRMEKAGFFPLRIRLGQLRVVWREDEIEQWMLARIEEGTHGNSNTEFTD